jgi:hypothetical protein
LLLTSSRSFLMVLWQKILHLAAFWFIFILILSTSSSTLWHAVSWNVEINQNLAAKVCYPLLQLEKVILRYEVTDATV